eukprot:5504793-Prymnesium_polylepis.1
MLRSCFSRSWKHDSRARSNQAMFGVWLDGCCDVICAGSASSSDGTPSSWATSPAGYSLCAGVIRLVCRHPSTVVAPQGAAGRARVCAEGWDSSLWDTASSANNSTFRADLCIQVQ